MNNNALITLAQWCADLQIDVEGPEQHMAKQALLDTVANALYGSTTDIAPILQQTMNIWGTGCCQVIGGNGRQTAPVSAALINAAYATMEDRCAYDNLSLSHSPSSIIAALLALSEHIEFDTATEQNIAGQQFLNAFIVGMEALMRISMALNPSHYYQGWHTTATLNALGATMACSHLLQLDANKSAVALSLATSRISGYKSQFGSMAKVLHAGFAAETGVICATLAQQGASAQNTTFDGEYSLLTLHGTKHSPGFAQAFADLNAKNQNDLLLGRTGIAYKPYPCCAFLHPFLDLMADIAHDFKQQQIPIESIKWIKVTLPLKHFKSVAFQNPNDGHQARFSLWYCLAKTLLNGHLCSADFDEYAVQASADPIQSIKPLMNKIQAEPSTDHTMRSSIQLQLNDAGHPIERFTTHAKGTPENPLDEKTFANLFHQSAQTVLDVNQSQAVYEQVLNLEKMPTIRPLLQQLNLQQTPASPQ